MKASKSITILLLNSLFLLATAIPAAAYYEPSVQRWINRDPFSDLGFQEIMSPDVARPRHADEGGPYQFLRNAPQADMDAWGLSPDIQGCRDKETQKIKEGLKTQCDKAKACAKKCRSQADKAASGIDKVCNETPKIRCVGKDWKFHDGASCDGKCGRLEYGSEIFLCPQTFTSFKGCGPPFCTVFHEALHWGGINLDSNQKHPMDFSDFENCMGCPAKGGL